MEEQGFQFDVVNPCLGKKGEGREMICLLIHVDDIMFTGRGRVVEEFTMELKKHFEVDVNKAEKVGDGFSFLKGKYEVVEEGVLVKPGQYAANVVKTFEEVYGEVKRQKLPCAAEIQELDTSNLITPQDAAIYRSIVGMGIYLSQEQLDIAYTIKELASKMSSPIEAALQHMRKLVGYLKEARQTTSTSCCPCARKDMGCRQGQNTHGCWKALQMLTGQGPRRGDLHQRQYMPSME